MPRFKYNLLTDQFQLRIQWIYEWYRPRGFHLNSILLPYTIFWFIESGRKTMIIDNRTYRVKKGDFIVIPPNVSFQVAASDDDTEQLHHLSLVGDIKVGPFDFVHLFQYPQIVCFTETDVLQRHIALWYELIKNSEEIAKLEEVYSDHRNPVNRDVELTVQYLQVNGMLHRWVASLLELYRPFLTESSFIIDSRIREVCLYIKDHLKEKLNMSTLSKQVYLSESYLRLLFRTYLGVSPMEYVRGLRTQRSRELLLTTEYSLKEIAEMCGYEDQSQFSKSFRKTEGVSPLMYRQQSKNV